MQVSPVDEMAGANPEVARSIYVRLAGGKVWEELDGGHFGLIHYPSSWFDAASSSQLRFLLRTMDTGRTATG